MYKTGQIVSCGTTGVCRIAGLVERYVDGKPVQYYQLEPVHSSTATILIPTDSKPLLAKLRPVLTADEVHALLNTLPDAPDLWIDSEQERQHRYHEIFRGSDVAKQAQLAYSLSRQRQILAAQGRRMRQSDETAWKEAERLLCDEFSFVLGTEPKEIQLRLRADG